MLKIKKTTMINIDNPAFDYEKFGQKYSGHRQTDPRIAEHVFKELEDFETIINVGAGTGSYEPQDKYVIAIEPSKVMRNQRINKGKFPAINATADSLPFDDSSFDASMAMVTIHHWPDIEKGLREMKRVTRKKVIIMTFDPESLDNFWNAEYFPEVIEIERKRYPKNELIINSLGGSCDIIPIPIPFDCVDGFQEAFYGRPEAFLKKEVRLNQSAWGFLPEGSEDKIVKRLEDDLKSGKWDEKYGEHRKMKTFTCALKLIVATL